MKEFGFSSERGDTPEQVDAVLNQLRDRIRTPRAAWSVSGQKGDGATTVTIVVELAPDQTEKPKTEES